MIKDQFYFSLLFAFQVCYMYVTKFGNVIKVCHNIAFWRKSFKTLSKSESGNDWWFFTQRSGTSVSQWKMILLNFSRVNTTGWKRSHLSWFNLILLTWIVNLFYISTRNGGYIVKKKSFGTKVPTSRVGW